MLLTHHREVYSITRGLIALTKIGPHHCNSAETHELRSKLRENTRSENSSSSSIIIAPLSVSRQIIPIDGESIKIGGYLLILNFNCSIIKNFGCIPISLRSINSKHRRNRRGRSHRSNRAERTGYLARENAPQQKPTHMDMHEARKLSIVGAVEDHRAPRNNDIARRRHAELSVFFEVNCHKRPDLNRAEACPSSEHERGSAWTQWPGGG